MFKKTKSEKTDYNIEYAHIYVNKLFGEEQKKSLRELQKLISQLDKKKQSYTLTVLIDDYNPVHHRLDTDKFLDKLKKMGYQPDFVGFESRLSPDKDWLLKKMSPKKRKEYQNYIVKSRKIPCSLFIAIWYLKRLGFLRIRGKEIISLNKKNKPFAAKKIITILPQKYQAVERKGLKIIESTKFKNCLENISDIFFK